MSAKSNLPAGLSGVYRTPPDAPAVQARALAAGAACVLADVGSITSKGGLLNSLAAALALPASFGRNWDALADSLQDLPVPRQGYVLHLEHAAGLQQALGADWPTFLEILREAAICWKGRGLAFVVLIDDAAGLPLWR